MNRLLVYIHTLPLLIDVFTRLGKMMLSDVQFFHILDEPLLARVRIHNGLLPDDIDRLKSHICMAEQIGAAAVLVTCSTLSPGIDPIQHEVSIPTFKIDEGMAFEAVAMGKRIGVIATAQSTLEPTRLMINEQAKHQGKEIEIQVKLVENALNLLLADKGGDHDRLVRKAIIDLSPKVDVIILAQASIARVLDSIPEHERIVPLLSSPYIALEHIRQNLSS